MTLAVYSAVPYNIEYVLEVSLMTCSRNFSFHFCHPKICCTETKMLTKKCGKNEFLFFVRKWCWICLLNIAYSVDDWAITGAQHFIKN